MVLLLCLGGFCLFLLLLAAPDSVLIRMPALCVPRHVLAQLALAEPYSSSVGSGLLFVLVSSALSLAEMVPVLLRSAGLSFISCLGRTLL